MSISPIGSWGAALVVYVQSWEATTETLQVGQDGVLYIQLTPSEKDPNGQVISLLAQYLEMPQKDFEILSGHHSNGKVVAVYGVTPAQLEQRLDFIRTSVRP